jgi:hypothetical protein
VKDKEFKKLSHPIDPRFSITLGTEVTSGYKPDLTGSCPKSRKLKIIIECEQKTDRKALLGSLIKAIKYSHECSCRILFVIVMKETTNTTIDQIYNHIKQYVEWLKKIIKNHFMISKTIIISDCEYNKCIKNKININNIKNNKSNIKIIF